MIRVYKRKLGDKRGYATYRRWNVGPTPEDSRETCWPSWVEAMAWATLPTDERRKQIELDNKMDGGW